MEGADLNWRKSSYSGNGGGECVEVADHDNRVLLRDTKQNGIGPVLRFSPSAWRMFAEQVKSALAAACPALKGTVALKVPFAAP